MPYSKGYPDYHNPISDLLKGEEFNILTDDAKKLLEGDLVALSWKNSTPRTEKLTVRDLNSIEEAFNKSSYSEEVGALEGKACCCCSCTPCCCCATAVIKAA